MISTGTEIRFPTEPPIGTAVRTRHWTYTRVDADSRPWRGIHDDAEHAATGPAWCDWPTLAWHVESPAGYAFPEQPPIGSTVRTATGGRWTRISSPEQGRDARTGCWDNSARQSSWSALLMDEGPVTVETSAS